MVSLKKNAKKLFLLGSLMGCFFCTLPGQFKLDVAGDTKIEGNITLFHSAVDSSLFIGGNAGASQGDHFPFRNTFIGTNSGQSSNGGEDNTFIGYNSGKAQVNAHENVFIGSRAGLENEIGSFNTFVGQAAGESNNGSRNTFIGQEAGYETEMGGDNTFIGYEAGTTYVTGSENTIIGSSAGRHSTNGTRNTFIGRLADSFFNPDSLDRAIAIGYNARVNCSNCAIIGGTGGDAVNVGIGTASPDYDLEVIHGNGAPSLNPGNGLSLKNNNGNSHSWQVYIGGTSGKLRLYKNEALMGTFDEISGNYTPNSDQRLKNNIKTISNQLSIIQRLRPTTYHFKGRSTQRKVYGLIAQEVQKVIPDIVLENEGENGETKTLGISYTELIPVLIAGMQEQQSIIQTQNKENKAQQQQLTTLTKRLESQQEAIEKLQKLVGPLTNQSNKFTSRPHLHQYQLSLKKQASIAQNQPNPFYQNTTIHYFIPENTVDAYLKVTSLSGTTLGETPLLATGNGQITLETDNYPIGTYFYSLIVDGKVMETKKMVLVK